MQARLPDCPGCGDMMGFQPIAGCANPLHKPIDKRQGQMYTHFTTERWAQVRNLMVQKGPGCSVRTARGFCLPLARMTPASAHTPMAKYFRRPLTTLTPTP